MDSPKKRRIFLLRHAETEYNRKKVIQGGAMWGCKLSITGENQARQIGKALKSKRIYQPGYDFSGRYIIASRTQRTLQTAQIIQKTLLSEIKTQIIIKEGLVEPDYGDWENKTYTEIEKLYPALLQEWLKGPCLDFKFPNGECLKNIKKRILTCFEKCVKEWLCEGSKDLIIVSHAFVNEIVLLSFLGAPVKNWRKLQQFNACINVISFYNPPYLWDRKIAVEKTNAVEHLYFPYKS